MTYTHAELVRNRNVSPEALEWRSWRRGQRLSIPEAAAMANVDSYWLQRVETGKVPLGKRTWAKLSALMARWKDRTP